MSIKNLTQSIRDNSAYEICWGTIKTLKIIDDQANELELRIENLKLENERLSNLISDPVSGD